MYVVHLLVFNDIIVSTRVRYVGEIKVIARPAH